MPPAPSLWFDSLFALVFVVLAWGATRAARWLTQRMVRCEDGPVSMTPGTITDTAILLSAGGVGWVFAASGASIWSIGLTALILCTFIVAGWTDARTGEIPDIVVVPVVALVLGLDIWNNAWSAVGSAIVLSLPFAVLAWLSANRGIGWGDVEIVALGGAILGVDLGLLALIASCFGAVCVAVCRRRLSEPVAFVPYIVVSTVVAMLVRIRS